MKRVFIITNLLQRAVSVTFFASALLLFATHAKAQLPTPPCGVNGLTFNQQAGFGGNNKMIIGGYGQNDGTICWNCYNDSLVHGRSKAFNMPTAPYNPSAPVPTWSARITTDMLADVWRFQVGMDNCYDSISWQNGLTMKLDGSIGIGTDNTYGYKMAVNGSIIAKNDMRVSLTGVSWPDYVFTENYYLKPLSLLEQEIDSLGHLPEMPSAEEVEQLGLSLPQVSVQLVKKVEELTLYTIEQQKQIEELRRLNAELQKAVERLLIEKQ